MSGHQPVSYIAWAPCFHDAGTTPDAQQAAERAWLREVTDPLLWDPAPASISALTEPLLWELSAVASVTCLSDLWVQVVAEGRVPSPPRSACGCTSGRGGCLRPLRVTITADTFVLALAEALRVWKNIATDIKEGRVMT